MFMLRWSLRRVQMSVNFIGYLYSNHCIAIILCGQKHRSSGPEQVTVFFIFIVTTCMLSSYSIITLTTAHT